MILQVQWSRASWGIFGQGSSSVVMFASLNVESEVSVGDFSVVNEFPWSCDFERRNSGGSV